MASRSEDKFDRIDGSWVENLIRRPRKRLSLSLKFDFVDGRGILRNEYSQEPYIINYLVCSCGKVIDNV